MDNNTPLLVVERSPSSAVNGSARRMPAQSPTGTTRPVSLVDAHIVQLVVQRDEKGYGMKVSGDNPVYVQSVKEGGPAEKAGLHAGDKILKVNGITVVTFTHTDVVDLIKSSSQVVLTVQQRTSRASMGSPSGAHGRPSTAHASTTITNPQPVDNVKQRQLLADKEQHYRLMIEKEQRYIDLLRSQLATTPDEKKFLELTKTEKNLQTLQAMLQRNQTELPHCDSTPSPISPETGASPNGNSEPPPLPKRTNRVFGNSATNKRSNTFPLPSHPNRELNSNDVQVDNPIYYPPPNGPPPPLPPRRGSMSPAPQTPPGDGANSINKQMSYPLVATCATLVNNYLPGNPTHQRTKSSPESLLNLSPSSEASVRLINSESMNDISRQETWDRPEAPPGTPPPPYPSPRMDRKNAPDDGDGRNFGKSGLHDCSMTDSSPMRNRVLVENAPIHAATPQVVQQPIISMEDDEISDQEMEQPEEHSPFKSLTRLWENPPHLAVFTNYVLSNADPNSLLFYLLTDLYKEGNAKEMKKWAFEIHSTFLVPGAPLRLGNVDENVAREIDDVLLREYDKEEILRKIFWKARARAKEELGRQLVDFQQKRTAGLGTLYGPVDSALSECYHDKSKELKHYESLFTEKLEPYLTELEKENYDPKKFYMAAALITVMQRIFGIRVAASQLERCPMFVNKEKSFKNKLLPGRYSRKLNIQGHQFIAQQYYTVILCNNCHQIIYGIGPQGYRCNDCNINLHRQCVKLYDDSCPGPVNKKDRGLGKILRIRPHESDHRRKASATSNFIHMERDRRQAEEKDSEINDNGESKPSQPVSRSGSDRRPDSVREEGGGGKHHDSPAGGSPDSGLDKNDDSPIDSSVSLPSSGNKKRNTSNINRSESVKEQSEKQRKQRRNISDPSQNKSGPHDIEHVGLSNTTDSGSSSNSNSSISYNGRLSESPSNPNDSLRGNRSDGDSDMDADSDHINWQDLISTEQLNNLPPHEKKRQDVINELFCTEKSHMRSLNVLHKIFYKPLQKSQVLKPDELSLIFPNIKELLQIHRQFNHEMTQKRREDPIVRNLGDLLLNMLSSSTGEAFKEAAAKFCERQQLALELIKERRKRDSKFDSILAEGEKKRQCRRLQFQAILPVEMQRLSKLPLLLERLIGAVQDGNGNEEELNKLNKAYQLSKEIANYVNEAARMALNHARLEDIQRHLDQSNFERSNDPISQEFRPLDLTKYKLVREGPMHLRRPNKSSVLVHVLLMEEVVVILHKEGDRYLLKNFQSGTSGQTNPLSPIIKISTLLVRINAVCKNALFLVNTSTMNSQMYDLRAEDDAKRDGWFKHFSDVTDAHNKKEGKTRRPEPTPDNEEDEESVQDFPQPQDVSERAEEVDHVENEDSFRTTPAGDAVGENELETEAPSEEKENCDGAATVEGGGNAGVPSRVTAEEWPLIQPSQVHVAVLPVHTAESRLTPIEQIRRKDEEVRRALKDKENLIADLLSIPQQDFHTIADMVSEEESTSDPINLTMASIYQTNRLQKIINDTLNLSDESDVVQATGGRSTSCTSQITPRSNQPPSIPVSQVQDIVNRLSKHLTELLDKQKQLEDEKSLLRNELYKMREKLHDQLSIHDLSGSSNVLTDSITLQNDEEVEMDSEIIGGS